MRMKSAALIAAIASMSVLATTPGVAAHHHSHHGNAGAIGNAQVGHVPPNPGNAVTERGAGDAPDTHTLDMPKNDKPAHGKTGNGPSPGRGNEVGGPVPSGKQGADAPLDLSVTVNQGRSGHRGQTFRQLDRPKGYGGPNSPGELGTFAPSGTDRNHRHAYGPAQNRPSELGSAPSRNAIGAVVDHGKPADHGGTVPAHPGASTTNGPPGPENGVPQGAGTRTPNLSPGGGAPIHAANGADAAATSAVHHNPGPDLPVGSVNSPVINGSAMIHPHGGAAAIGGSVRVTSGVLNGTGFHTRHP
jgi:hypothetical protein